MVVTHKASETSRKSGLNVRGPFMSSRKLLRKKHGTKMSTFVQILWNPHTFIKLFHRAMCVKKQMRLVAMLNIMNITQMYTANFRVYMEQNRVYATMSVHKRFVCYVFLYMYSGCHQLAMNSPVLVKQPRRMWAQIPWIHYVTKSKYSTTKPRTYLTGNKIHTYFMGYI